MVCVNRSLDDVHRREAHVIALLRVSIVIFHPVLSLSLLLCVWV
jgi:hypothetical protein